MAGQMVSLHTKRGVQLYQFLPDDQFSMKWTRELRQTSICHLAVPPRFAVSDITPGLHWVSVWDDRGEQLLWTGEIQSVDGGRDNVLLECADASSLYQATRSPVSKRWEVADPADIADELWRAMIDLHGLHTKPIVRADPRGDRFDFQTVADEKMLDEVIRELTDLGLFWSVVAGVPILGPVQFGAVTTLGEDDFVGGGLRVKRDCRRLFNDVLLQAADGTARARVEAGGLNRQTILTQDSIFGVSNADRAVRQAVRFLGSMRDAVTVPDGAVLAPGAPLGIEHCIPSARVVIDAYGMRTLMEIRRVTVTRTSDSETVALGLESVNDDLPELLENPDDAGSVA